MLPVVTSTSEGCCPETPVEVPPEAVPSFAARVPDVPEPEPPASGSSVAASGELPGTGGLAGLRNATVIISTRIPATEVTPARRRLSLVLERRFFLRLLFISSLSE
jgi:hypothetical protein